MDFIHKQTKEVFVVLYDSVSGEPKTGLTETDIVLKYAKEGDDALTVKTLVSGSAGNFLEIGEGIYRISFIETELDTVGQLIISISGALIEHKHIMGDVKHPQFFPAASPDCCVIKGDIKKLTGAPAGKPYEVKAHILELPEIRDRNLISIDVVRVFSDIDGFFKTRLVKGALVILEIPATGYRRQFTVPDNDAIDLIDIP